MLGTTLEELLNQLASETGNIQSPSYGIGARDARVNILKRVQEFLWQKHEWSHLSVKRDIDLQAGSRFYNFPADLDPKRVLKVSVKYGGVWQEVGFGIDEDSDVYFTYDPDLDRRSDPALLWDRYRDGTANQIQILPIPSTNANTTTKENVLRIKGIKILSNLVASSDVADLDDRVIVLFAASEILAKIKSPDASAKLAMANQLYGILTGNEAGDESFSLGAPVSCDNNRPRMKIRAVYNGSAGA